MDDKPDVVNHPPHYKSGGIEAIDVIEAFQLDFRLGSVIKYVLRADKKGTRELDLQKARWYLDRVISGAEAASKKPPTPNFNPSLVSELLSQPGDIIIPWEDFLRDARTLAQKLKDPVKMFVAVTRDGLFPTGVITHFRTSQPRVPIRTFNINKYQGRTSGRPQYEDGYVVIDGGRGALFIDAIADTGETAEAIKALFPMAKIACVYVKPKGKGAIDYWAVELPQEPWVVFPWDEK